MEVAALKCCLLKISSELLLMSSGVFSLAKQAGNMNLNEVGAASSSVFPRGGEPSCSNKRTAEPGKSFEDDLNNLEMQSYLKNPFSHKSLLFLFMRFGGWVLIGLLTLEAVEGVSCEANLPCGKPSCSLCQWFISCVFSPVFFSRM